MLTPDSIASPAAEKKMVGSVFICEADSLEAVRQLMESDVYYESGVVSEVTEYIAYEDITDGSGHWQWDREKLLISPLALATPLP